jgi:hypothetical protein
VAHDDAGPRATLGAALGVAVFLVVVVLIQAVFYRAARLEEERSGRLAVPAELASTRAEQRELLGAYRLVDPAKGVVAIPVELAMARVVVESAPPGTR